MTELLSSIYDKNLITIHNETKDGSNLQYNEYNRNKKLYFLSLRDSSMNYQNIEQYFKIISQKLPDIEVTKNKLGGMPVIKNTRIPISMIIACIKDGMTFEDICNEYELTKKDIEKAMEYVIDILDVPYQEG